MKKIIVGILTVFIFLALGLGVYYLVTHWENIFSSSIEKPEEPVERVEITDWVFNNNSIAQYKGTETEITNIPSSYSTEEKVVKTVECKNSEDFINYVFSCSEDIESPVLYQTNLIKVTYNELNFSKTYDSVGALVVESEGLVGEYGESLYNMTISELETKFYEGSEKTVDTLSGTAFYGLSVKSIDIPANITKLNGFIEPESLESVTLRAETVIENTSEYLAFFEGDCTIFVPENLVEEYKTTYSFLTDRIFVIE